MHAVDDRDQVSVIAGRAVDVDVAGRRLQARHFFSCYCVFVREPKLNWRLIFFFLIFHSSLKPEYSIFGCVGGTIGGQWLDPGKPNPPTCVLNLHPSTPTNYVRKFKPVSWFFFFVLNSFLDLEKLKPVCQCLNFNFGWQSYSVLKQPTLAVPTGKMMKYGFMVLHHWHPF